MCFVKFQNVSGTSAERQWDASGMPVGCQWDVSGMPVGCQWNASGMPGECQWNASGMPVGCQWNASGTPVERQWNASGTPAELSSTGVPLVLGSQVQVVFNVGSALATRDPIAFHLWSKIWSTRPASIGLHPSRIYRLEH